MTSTATPGVREVDGFQRAHAAAGECVFAELRRSRVLFPVPLCSVEEALSVLEEELDEVKDALRANMIEHARSEATQVAAMALRLVIDVAGRGACTARDRLAVEATVTRAGCYGPAGFLGSAHEGNGHLRCWYQRMCAAVVEGDLQRVSQSATAIAVVALRFVAEVPGIGGRAAAGRP